MTLEGQLATAGERKSEHREMACGHTMVSRHGSSWVHGNPHEARGSKSTGVRFRRTTFARSELFRFGRFGHEPLLSLRCTASVWRTQYLCFFSFFTRCF
jgi:hypothetical protein